MLPQDKDYNSLSDEFLSASIHEAEKHDRALMQPIKDDMNRVVVFAGLYSAALIASLAPVIASRRLTTASINKSIAMLNEYASVLFQISQQRGLEDPSKTVISPFASFTPNHTDLIYKIFWLLSLGFSMAAALGGIIVQQRICDYLQIFHQSTGNPLERLQMRQYLFRPVVNNVRILVKCTTAFTCISIFFFFIGLGNSLVVMYNAVS